ncbi:hypothetical protein [Fibrella aestuarina]|nr:hypothetical protein [Fibrella aestuarina]
MNVPAPLAALDAKPLPAATPPVLSVHVTGMVAENADLRALTEAAKKLDVSIESVDGLAYVTEQRLALRRLRLDFNANVDTYLAPFKASIDEAEKVKVAFVTPAKQLEERLKTRVAEFTARQADEHVALLKKEQGLFSDRDALLKANGFAYQPDENVYKKGRHKIPVHWLRCEPADWEEKTAKCKLEDIAPQQAAAINSFFDDHRADIGTLKRFWQMMPTVPDPETMRTDEGRAIALQIASAWETMQRVIAQLTV